MRYTLLAMLCGWSLCLNAQTAAPRWSAALGVGQYAASLATPKFSPIRLGIHAGAGYEWYKNSRYALLQHVYLGYFKHTHLQHALQGYTELGYQRQWESGLRWMPLAIGGGYVAAVSDMTVLQWNNNQYTMVKNAVRHNFLASLGTTVGYQTNWKISNYPMGLFAAYRLQIQGILVKQTIPVIAYSVVQIGTTIYFE